MLCPHCQTEVADDSAFCPSCGKAVRAGGGGPRVVGKSELAASLTGQSLQSDELRKQMKKAFGALLAVAILQTLAAVVIGFLLAGQPDGLAIAIAVGGLAAMFYGMAVWARWQPFPAAVTGLTILATLWLLDAVMDPSSLLSGFIIKFIILLVLVRAVQAGAKHRKLMRAMLSEQAARA